MSGIVATDCKPPTLLKVLRASSVSWEGRGKEHERCGSLADPRAAISIIVSQAAPNYYHQRASNSINSLRSREGRSRASDQTNTRIVGLHDLIERQS